MTGAANTLEQPDAVAYRDEPPIDSPQAAESRNYGNMVLLPPPSPQQSGQSPMQLHSDYVKMTDSREQD